ncbi:hypothetical protein [Bacillus infantis]|uniref:hypothetical protein n=1 Tax=Bacillus infantis TaxID=324767 RepID=UPI003219C4EC
MGVFGGLFLTNKGRNLQVKAQTGVQLNFTRMAIGDGFLGSSSLLERNRLVSEKMSLPLTKLRALPGGQATLGAVLNNQDISSGFYFRELGIYATDPDAGEILYMYGNAGNLADYIPAGQAGSTDLLEQTIDVAVLVGNATNVSATINQSLVYVTPEEAQAIADQAKEQAIEAAGQMDIDILNAAKNVEYLGYKTKNQADPPSSYPHGMSHALCDRTTNGFDPAGSSESFYGIVTYRLYPNNSAAWQYAYPYSSENKAVFIRKGNRDTDTWEPWETVGTKSDTQKAIEQTFFKTKKSSKNADNGTYAVVEKRREDGTLAMRATFLNPNADGLYQNRKHEFFAANGTTVEKTITTTITYDADGEFLEEA